MSDGLFEAPGGVSTVSATNKVLGRSSAGAGPVEEIDCTAAGRALLDDATAADQRTTLGLADTNILDIVFDAVARTNAWAWTTTLSTVAYLWQVAAGVMRMRATGPDNHRVQLELYNNNQGFIIETQHWNGASHETTSRIAGSRIGEDEGAIDLECLVEGNNAVSYIYMTAAGITIGGAAITFDDPPYFNSAIAAVAYTPAQITSNQTNFAGLNGRSYQTRVSTDALRELQGIAAGVDGEVHALILTGSNNLTIKHNSVSATGKRIYCHGSADITLAPNDVVFLMFDSTTDVWRAWTSELQSYSDTQKRVYFNGGTYLSLIDLGNGVRLNVAASGGGDGLYLLGSTAFVYPGVGLVGGYAVGVNSNGDASASCWAVRGVASGVGSLRDGVASFDGGTIGAPAYTPSQITSTQNNYASIHGRSLQVRLSSDAARTINGVTAGQDGEVHILRNVGSYNITFAHQSGSATGAQIYCDTVTDTCLEPGARALIEYDATSSRWCLSKFDNGQYRRYTPYGSWTFYDETGSYGAYIQNAFGGTVFQCQSGPKVTHADIDLAAQALNGGASHGSYDTAFQRVAAGVWGVGNGDDYNPGGAISFLPLSPSQITSNQTNYSAFIGGSKIVRVSTDALRELQGIAAGTDGVEHTLILTGSNNLTIKHNSGSATGKRIYCHGSADITLSPNDVVFLTFDSTTDVWRAWASNTALYDLRITATADPQTPIVITDPYANTLRLLCSSGNYQLLADGGQLRFACDDGGQTGFLAKNDGTVAYLSQGTSVGSIDGTHGLYLARGAFGGDASVPSQITSNQTSWDAGSAHPEDKEWVRFSTDADGREIQGMTAWSAHGYVREFVNVGSFTAVFKHASGSATGKQLRCSTGADITCGPNGVVRIRWDATSDVLRVMPLF